MIEQKRILATSIPGPASQALQARKTAAVAAGVSTGLPVYVTEGAGGIVRDADGNQLIDFGSGIAVTTVGNGNQRVVDAVTEQIAAFTHTCFMVTPYDKYVQVCEKLNELTPGDHEKRSALFNSGAEAVENAVKIARHATGRPAVVAFDHALPRPHQPHDGPDREEHALQAPLRAVRGRALPRADGLPLPLAGRRRALRRGGPAHRRRPDPRPGRRGQHRGRHHRADPGRGRLHRAARGLPARAGRLVPRARHPAHRRRGADRLLPHRRLVRLRPRGRRPRPRSPPPRASPAACRSPPSPGAPT